MDLPWRDTRRKLEETIERQLLADRECGKLPPGLTGEQIRRMAYEKAVATVSQLENERRERGESV